MLDITEYPPVPGSVSFNEVTMSDLSRWQSGGTDPSRGMFNYVGSLVANKLFRLGTTTEDMWTIQDELTSQMVTVASAGDQKEFKEGFSDQMWGR